MWEQFVADCEEAYDDNIYEFENNPAVRDLIEHALKHRNLRPGTEMAWFRDHVDVVDPAIGGCSGSIQSGLRTNGPCGALTFQAMREQHWPRTSPVGMAFEIEGIE